MTETKTSPGLISIGQAAKYLGISRDTLRRWEKAGKITPVRSPTNRRYYTKKQLDELMMGKKGETISQVKKAPLTKIQKPVIAGILAFIIAIILATLFLRFLL